VSRVICDTHGQLLSFYNKHVKVALRCSRSLQTPENAMRAMYPDPKPQNSKPNQTMPKIVGLPTKPKKRIKEFQTQKRKKQHMMRECTSGKSEERRGAYLKATSGMSSVYISNLLPLWVGNSVDNRSVRAVRTIGHLHWCCAPEGAHTEGGLANAVEA
jgi:hypothetical protein